MTRIFNFTCIFLLLLFSLQAWAVELFVWQAKKGGPQIIMAQLDGESKKDAIERYLKSVANNPALKNLLKNIKLPDGEIAGKEKFIRNKEADTPQIILNANKFGDMFSTEAEGRVQVISNHIKAQGGEAYVLPVVADLGLSEKDAKDFYKKVARKFDAMISLGGADVDGSLYGETNKFSAKTNLLRDTSELAFMNEYLDTKKGVFFGICRGAQLCSVAHGHKLIQDIASETNAEINHRSGEHKIIVDLKSWLGKTLKENIIEVNSLHHQAIEPNGASALRVSAVSADKSQPIIEAMEGTKVQLVQFHPEKMNNKIGREIINGFIEDVIKNKKYSALEEVKISDLRPTQFSLGYDDVAKKAEKYAGMSEKKFKKYNKENPIFVVIGPNQEMYIVDGHHQTRALYDMGEKKAKVRILADFHKLSEKEFWKTMQDQRLVWLYDEHGKGPLPPERLPNNIGLLKDDPYRSLAGDLVEKGLLKKNKVPYFEFYWANFLRSRVKIAEGDKGKKQALKEAEKWVYAISARDLPGYPGKWVAKPEVGCAQQFQAFFQR